VTYVPDSFSLFSNASSSLSFRSLNYSSNSTRCQVRLGKAQETLSIRGPALCRAAKKTGSMAEKHCRAIYRTTHHAYLSNGTK
jgi:hypothetical protein